jgi:hypothetical protein
MGRLMAQSLRQMPSHESLDLSVLDFEGQGSRPAAVSRCKHLLPSSQTAGLLRSRNLTSPGAERQGPSSRQECGRGNMEGLGELDHLLLGERPTPFQDGGDGGLRDADLLRELRLTQPVRIHQFAKHIRLGSIRDGYMPVHVVRVSQFQERTASGPAGEIHPG